MNPQPSRFSLRSFILSLTALALTAALVAVDHRETTQASVIQMAPIVRFEEGEMVQIKPFANQDYIEATNGQSIFSGSYLKTAEGSVAEITLNKTQFELKENTELEFIQNNSGDLFNYASQTPRLHLGLNQGQLWVNADHPIQIESNTFIVQLNHATAFLDMQSNLSQVAVLDGSAELKLKNEQGQIINKIVVPLNSQVSFSADQITQNYLALEPSKLRKELNAQAVTNQIENDPWYLSLEDKKSNVAYHKQTLNSELRYAAQISFENMQSALAIRPQAQLKIDQSRLQSKLSYLLGKLKTENDRLKAQEVLDEIDGIIMPYSKDRIIQKTLKKTFAEVQGATFGTVEYMLKEKLFTYLMPSEGPSVLAVHLADFARLMESGQIESAAVVLDKWATQWTEQIIQSDLDEYEREGQILKNILRTHIAEVTVPMLDHFDQTGQNRMQHREDKQEIRFEVAQDRLDIVTSLLASYQYPLAKQYLKNSYLSLDIVNLSENSSTAELFLETGTLLARRIDYALNILGGQAIPIDETAFQNYLDERTRDELLVEDLSMLLDIEAQAAEPIPKESQEVSAQEVFERLTALDFEIELENIQAIDASQGTFQLKDVVKPTNDPQVTYTFEAQYAYAEDALTNINLNEQLFKGPVLLEDMNRLLVEADSPSASSTDENVPGLDELLTDQSELTSQEDQALANDLAVRLALSQLQAAGVTVTDPKTDIQITDSVSLEQFNIQNALIKSTVDEREFAIRFDYSTQTQMAQNITQIAEGEGLSAESITDSVSIEALANVVTQFVLKQEEAQKTLEELETFLGNN